MSAGAERSRIPLCEFVALLPLSRWQESGMILLRHNVRKERYKEPEGGHDEMEKLKIRSKVESKRINELSAERAILTTRLRDRDEELKGKRSY
jgi:hypothetical protein